MPKTIREDCLCALHEALKAIMPDVQRNTVVPEKLHNHLIVLRDGISQIVDPDLTGYGGYFEENCELEVMTPHQKPAARDMLLDQLFIHVQTALYVSNNLNQRVDVLNALSPEITTDQDGAAMVIKAAVIPIRFQYYAENALALKEI